MSLSLPQDLSKGDRTLTASTPTEYWNLVARGFKAPDDTDLSPQQKAARTRAARRAEEDQVTSNDGNDVVDPAGSANGQEVPQT